MATINKNTKQSDEEVIALNLTREDVRVLRQALNEVCNGITLSDEEFSTRMGTSRNDAIELMQALGHVDKLYH